MTTPLSPLVRTAKISIRWEAAAPRDHETPASGFPLGPRIAEPAGFSQQNRRFRFGLTDTQQHGPALSVCESYDFLEKGIFRLFSKAESSLGPDSHHPIISLSGIPSAVIVFRILHPIFASTLCAANPLARIAEPTIAL